MDLDHYLYLSRAFVDECAKKYADLLPHLGTANVARDVDRIRAALGDPKISFVGYSYGTSIGQQYAKEFPTHLRALILDGVVDPSVDGLTAAADQAAGFERALDAYIGDCDARNCIPGGARAAIDRVVADAEKAPIPATGADRPVTPGVVNVALGYALYSDFLWADLTDALRSALRNDGTDLVQLADGYLQRDSDGTYGGLFEIYFAVGCLDAKWPRNPDTVFAAAKRAAKSSPNFGEAIVNDYVRCALWPTPPQPLTPVPSGIHELPPVLVISTTGDPATPYENGVHVAKQIPGARLVTHRGEGHTVFMQGTSSCVDDLGVDYLLTAEVPSEDVTC